MKWALAVSIFLFSVASPAHADIQVIIIDKSTLPYSLNPSNFENSPSNFDNSSSNFENSVSNFENTPSNYENSKSNYENTSSGNRNVLMSDGRRIGYYVWSKNGVLNFYNDSGRVFFLPSGGHTQSVFASEGQEWCGTLGEMNGQTVLGITRNCLLRMMME
jgi:hypothetical protein